MAHIIVKKIFQFSSLWFLLISCAYACNASTTPGSPDFCNSFKTATQCHCMSTFLPIEVCSNPKMVYSRMISLFKNLDTACKFQKETSPEICVKYWSFFIAHCV